MQENQNKLLGREAPEGPVKLWTSDLEFPRL